jgi:putative aldouronate transport system permease protein
MRSSVGEKAFAVFNTLVMVILAAVTIYPLIHVLFGSLSEPGLIVSHQGPILHPVGFSLDAYRSVLANPNILSGYGNTLFYVIVGTAVNMVLTILAGYVLSRRSLKARNVLMFMVVFTMFFDGGLIPFFLLVKRIGLTDTRWSQILPHAIIPFYVIICVTYLRTIPDSIEDSARIDGANDIIILVRILVPLAIPVVAIITLFYVVDHWNAWFYAMVFLRRRELYPLQLILREILIISSTDSMLTMSSATDKVPLSETIKYATIMITTVPVLAVYPFLQKYFVQGMMVGAIKF